MSNGGDVESGVSSCVPAALLKTLDEDELDPEERVQRCQADARQFLQAKPDMAWSRAQQAITLLGRPGSLAAVTDEAAASRILPRPRMKQTSGRGCQSFKPTAGVTSSSPYPDNHRPPGPRKCVSTLLIAACERFHGRTSTLRLLLLEP
jgi:hypothetical protein